MCASINILNFVIKIMSLLISLSILYKHDYVFKSVHFYSVMSDLLFLQERESLVLLDEKRVSVLYVPSGKTKRSIAKVSTLLPETVCLTSSPGGEFNF